MYCEILILSLISFSFGQLPGVDPNAVGGAIKGAGLLGALNQKSLTDILSDPCKGVKTAGNVQTTNQLGNAASNGLNGNLGGLVTNLGQAAKAQQEAKQNEQKCNNFLNVLGIGGGASKTGSNTGSAPINNSGGGLFGALKPNTGANPNNGNPIGALTGSNHAANLNSFNP